MFYLVHTHQENGGYFRQPVTLRVKAKDPAKALVKAEKLLARCLSAPEGWHYVITCMAEMGSTRIFVRIPGGWHRSYAAFIPLPDTTQPPNFYEAGN